MPMEEPITRYSRHTLLNVFGENGQDKIERSRVFVAGLGALGSLISILLARAGVGFLRVADWDAPELHNIHRQILYDEAVAVFALDLPQDWAIASDMAGFKPNPLYGYAAFLWQTYRE